MKVRRRYQNGGGVEQTDPPKKEKEETSLLDKLSNWKKNLSNNIYPYSYGQDMQLTPEGDWVSNISPLERMYDAIFLDKKEVSRGALDKEGETKQITERTQEGQERVDLLNVMLGEDLTYNSIRPSEYRYPKASNPDTKFWSSPTTENELAKELLYYADQYEYYKKHPEEKASYNMFGAPAPDRLLKRSPYGDVLGRFNINKGKDEKGSYVEYYDRWDVNPLSDKSGHGGKGTISEGFENIIQSALGIKPPEVYGRVYYDPKTGRPLDKFTGPKEEGNGGKMKVIKK